MSAIAGLSKKARTVTWAKQLAICVEEMTWKRKHRPRRFGAPGPDEMARVYLNKIIALYQENLR